MNLRGLGDRVRQRTTTGPHARETRDRDERTSTLGFLQVRLRRIQQPQMTLDIDAETPVPIVLVDLLLQVEEIRQPRPARVADHDVQTAEFLDRLGYKALDLGFLLHVRLDGVEARLRRCVVRVCGGDLGCFFNHLLGLFAP